MYDPDPAYDPAIGDLVGHTYYDYTTPWGDTRHFDADGRLLTDSERLDGSYLRLTEREVAALSANALAARIWAATFPVRKEFDTFDFTACPSLSKQKPPVFCRGGNST